MIVPAAVAPIVLAITGKLPTGKVEAAAVSGLIAGWVLQIALGALPLRLRELRHLTAGWDGCWGSVVLLNLGVLLNWVSAFIPSADLTSTLMVAGYALMAIAATPPIIAILKLLLSGPGPKAPDPQPAEIAAQM